MHTPELLQQHPKLATAFPCLPLATLPTPVKQYPDIRNNLWVKHDDQSSKLYGGNKVRKLEFILARAQQQNKHHIITFGGTGTNHGLATALFCRELGLKCTVLLFDQPESIISKRNYAAMYATGAELIHCGSLFNTALSFYTSLRIRHPGAYFLFAGGSTIEGCLAFVNAAFELKHQIDQGALPLPEAIFCAVGSNGTCAGLSLGCHMAGLPTSVYGVRVANSHLGPIPSCTSGKITQLMKQTVKAMRRSCPEISSNLPPIHLLQDYFGEGYGIPTQEGNNATDLFLENNIQLESTYSAKAAAACLDYCDDNVDNTVLFWNTYNSVDIGLTPGSND